MSDLLHTFAHLSYKEKREKVLAVLGLYDESKKIFLLINTITKNKTYNEHNLDEIYNTLIRYAYRKQNAKQDLREKYIELTKNNKEASIKQEKKEADILLDSLLDNRCE